MSTTRRLFTQGNSLVMVITADVAAHLGVRDGDMIELFKESRKRITLRKYHTKDEILQRSKTAFRNYFPP